MNGDRLCYTCTHVVTDLSAKHCTRAFCAARRDVERATKPQGTREPQRNPGERPKYYDDGGGI